MPELKRNFAKGRMNKDFDERLVPNGEYRHASNIEVATSEDSDVGSAQSLLGNSLKTATVLPDGCNCVGSIVNNKEDKLYWLVAGPFDGTQYSSTVNYLWKDYVLEFDHITKTTMYVMVDIYQVTTVGITSGGAGQDITVTNNHGIRNGMQLTAVKSDGSIIINTADKVFVDGMFTPGNPYTESTTNIRISTASYNIPSNSVLTFTAPRVLNFHKNQLITGINIIDGMLFWTDNYTEPKKINILRSIAGTGGNTRWNSAGSVTTYPSPNKLPYTPVGSTALDVDNNPNYHTRLVGTSTWRGDNTIASARFYEIITNQKGTLPIWIDESYITVIKKGPLTPPILEMSSTEDVRGYENTSNFVKINKSDGYALGATSMIIDALPMALFTGTLITFTGGGTFIISTAAALGATTIVGTTGLQVLAVANNEVGYLNFGNWTENAISTSDTFNWYTQNDNINYNGSSSPFAFAAGDSLSLFPDGTPIGTQAGGVLPSVGTEYTLYFNSAVDYRVGDIIIFTNDSSASQTTFTEHNIRAEVIGSNITPANPIPWTGPFRIKVTTADTDSLNAGTNIPDATETWYSRLQQPKPLFEFKFPRFSYRYKYEDGEYSTFGPWSELAFLPSDFDYIPKKGFNLGMTNNLRNLKIKNYVVEDSLRPRDVTEIDILYKETNSPTVYTVKTIKNETGKVTAHPEWPDNRNYAKNRGELEITSDLIHAVVPSNQLLRPWDNVPRKALAQEITGNRLLYGNYLQNYNLNVYPTDDVSPEIELSVKTEISTLADLNLNIPSPGKSIKSMRTYQVGVVYGDAYGRETPVLASKSKKGSVTVKKEDSINFNKLQVRLKSNPPTWAKTYKYYIKETSNEYYNLAMDRWYDAEDGNVWLSFASSERNKVDEDTFLILKKEHDNNNPVIDKARYKILAIENEAPEFIKKNKKSMGLIVDSINRDVFCDSAGLGFPLVGRSYMWIDQTNFENMGWHDNESLQGTDVFIRMVAPGSSGKSAWYRTSGISLNTISGAHYQISIDGQFKDDMAITSTDGTFVNRLSGLSLELQVEEVVHKPEFEGRFFVKIYKDLILEDRILKRTATSKNYSVRLSMAIPYINNCCEANNNNPTQIASSQYLNIWNNNVNEQSPGTSATDFAGNLITANFSVTPTCTYPDPLTSGRNALNAPQTNANVDTIWACSRYGTLWHINAKKPPIGATIFGGAGSTRQGNIWWDVTLRQWNLPGFHNRFFIDAADGWTSNPFGALNLWTQLPKNWSAGGNNGLGTLGTNGVNMSRGIYDNGNHIDISFAGITGNDPTIGSIYENATDYIGQILFIDTLITTGTIWRFKNDPDGVVYRTRGLSAYCKVIRNYWLERQIYSLTMMDFDIFEQFANKRERWRIQVDALPEFVTTPGVTGIGCFGRRYSPTNNPEFDESAGDPAPGIRADGQKMRTDNADQVRYEYDDNNLLVPKTGSSANDLHGFDTIEILEEFEEGEEEKTQSNNPAIWETEPKEDIGLDIYYEASQAYPLDLDAATNEQYVPIGSTFFCTNCASPTQEYIVTTWNDQTATFDFYPSTGTPPNTCIADGEVITFNTPFGGSITGMIDNPSVDCGDTATVHGDRNVSRHSHKALHNQLVTLPWFNCYSFGNGVESDRIRDDYNQVTIDNGVKASTVLAEQYVEDRRRTGLIFSGIYNSTSNVNRLNQFIQAEPITKDLNPHYGSIQKLHTRNADVLTFCEDKILKVQANKDALYGADGNVNVTATNKVLGQTIPFQGEYGISKNPESFASHAYRIYFSDRSRGAVLRLSGDGITNISNIGMKDWFADNFKKLSLHTGFEKIIGSYDENRALYNITLSNRNKYSTYVAATLSFSEDIRGWASFKSFIPENGISLNNQYYTFNDGDLWQHHDQGNIVTIGGNWGISSTLIQLTQRESNIVPGMAVSGLGIPDGTTVVSGDVFVVLSNASAIPNGTTITFSTVRNNFYGVSYSSSISVLFNDAPEIVKSFGTLNYEGSQAKITKNILTGAPSDGFDGEYYNNVGYKGWYVSRIETDLQTGTNLEFKNKEGKWFSNMRGETTTLSNLDTQEFSVQGIGECTVVGDTGKTDFVLTIRDDPTDH